MRTILILVMLGLHSMAATGEAQVSKQKSGCCARARPGTSVKAPSTTTKSDAPANVRCPICDTFLNASPMRSPLNGFSVGLCQDSCALKFAALSELDKNDVFAKSIRPVNSRCAVSGCESPPGPHLVTFRGSVVSLCCDTCRNRWYDAGEDARNRWVQENVLGLSGANGVEDLNVAGFDAKVASGETYHHVAKKPCCAKPDAQNVIVKERTQATTSTRSGCCSKKKPAKAVTSALPDPTTGTANSSSAKPGCSGNAMQMSMILLEVKGLDQEETAASVRNALQGMKGAWRVTVNAESNVVRFLTRTDATMTPDRVVDYLSVAGFDVKEASDTTYDRVAKKMRSEGAIVKGLDAGDE